jgi:DeoR family transcriptional regulator of aga operon
VIVSDASKLGQAAFARVGGAELFPVVITDSGVAGAQRAALTDAGFEVRVAG